MAKGEIANFIVYAPSGEILRTGQCSREQVALQGSLVLEGEASDLNHYILVGKVTPRPVFDLGYSSLQVAADGIDELLITAIPTGTQCMAQGMVFTVNDGALHFATSEPGAFTISFHKFPYKDLVLNCEAT